VAFVIDFTFVGVALELSPYAGPAFFEYVCDLDARSLPSVHATNDLALREGKMCEMPLGL
jgi:hypothetical protein